jgi:hypothetical protein
MQWAPERERERASEILYQDGRTPAEPAPASLLGLVTASLDWSRPPYRERLDASRLDASRRPERRGFVFFLQKIKRNARRVRIR